MSRPGLGPAWVWLAAALMALPFLMAGGRPPISTLPNQLAALAAGGAVLMMFHAKPARRPWALHQALLGGLALAGLVSSVMVIQPLLWGAVNEAPARAMGALRQPNHLASLLVWAAGSLVALQVHQRWKPPLAWLGMALLMTALVLTGSRTGLLGVGLLILWGLVDHRLPRASRQILCATPVMVMLAWWMLPQLATVEGSALQAPQRLLSLSGDVSSLRLAIWRDALSLISSHPGSGVGWGQFNLAWSLTPMAQRPPELFDHTHNLVLQLMVELGIPLGLLLSLALAGLMLWALRRAWKAEGEGAVLQRCCAGLLWVMALHSLLEYPLWYAHFLVPTVMALCLVFSEPNRENAAAHLTAVSTNIAARTGAQIAGLALGAAMLLAAGAAYVDYQSVSDIYAPSAGAKSLQQRMARGQQSWLFSRYADYAVATNQAAEPQQPWPPNLAHAFAGASHLLLDPKLMKAWAQAYAARNGPQDLDRARYLAARLREFKTPGAQAWFEECARPRTAGANAAFQCEAPVGNWSWRDFVGP